MDKVVIKSESGDWEEQSWKSGLYLEQHNDGRAALRR